MASAKTLDVIKKMFDCNSLDVLASNISDILSVEGSSMSRLYLCKVDKLQFVVKLTFYRKEAVEIYKNVDEYLPTPDVDLETLTLLKREVIDRGVTPCIIELLWAHRCSGMHVKDSECKRVLASATTSRNRSIADDLIDIICRHDDMVKKGLSHDRCSYIALEFCNMTFSKYLGATVTPLGREVFKSLMFQIIHCLTCLGHIYENFYHGDLHTDNILLRIDTSYDFSANQHIALRFGDLKFNIPYFGIYIKIIDFEFAHVPTHGIKSVRIADPGFEYYNTGDMVKLFRWIDVHNIQYNDILTELMPSRAFMDHPASLSGGEITTPHEMMQNPMFKKWRAKVAKNKIIGSYGIDVL
jgi:hypothetical protein